jgi:hypothetical protein
MKRLFCFIMVILTVAFIVSGCGTTISSTPAEHVEIWSVINRYINSLCTLQYSQAKACLVPGGPTDKNLDVVYGQMVSAFSHYIDIGCPPSATFEIVKVMVKGEEAAAEIGETTFCLVCSLIGPQCETNNDLLGKGIYLQKYNGEWRIY